MSLKAISHQGVITSLNAKVDGSLGYRMNTPELSPEEKAMFFELQNLNLQVTLKPAEVDNVDEYKLDKEIERYTPSQRLRRVLYVYWQQQGSKGYFDTFYKQEVEKIINQVKVKLE